MPTEPTLLPCPFCGSDDVGLDGDMHNTWVTCADCFAQGPNVKVFTPHDETVAKEFWNTRKDPPHAE